MLLPTFKKQFVFAEQNLTIDKNSWGIWSFQSIYINNHLQFINDIWFYLAFIFLFLPMHNFTGLIITYFLLNYMLKGAYYATLFNHKSLYLWNMTKLSNLWIHLHLCNCFGLSKTNLSLLLTCISVCILKKPHCEAGGKIHASSLVIILKLSQSGGCSSIALDQDRN